MTDFTENYYVDGKGFDKYVDALQYADTLLKDHHVYKCIFTRAEMQSQNDLKPKCKGQVSTQ